MSSTLMTPSEDTASATAERPAGSESSPTPLVALPPVGVWKTLQEIAIEGWHSRELLWQLTLRDLRLRYKQALMGFAWALFMPLVIVGAGLIIKFAMSQAAGIEINRADMAAVTVKSLPWAFFAGAIGFATGSLVGNSNLITKIYFPREVMPLSAVCVQTVDSTVGAVPLTFLLFAVLHVGFSAELLWVPLLVAVLFTYTTALALFLSCANLFFRDVKYIVQVLINFGIFMTPVFYDAKMLGPTGAKVIMLNPLAPILEGLRLAIVEHHNLLVTVVATSRTGVEFVTWHPLYLVYAGAVALGGLFGAALMFHKLEFVYAEYV